MIVLGIETSCDETAAAVVRLDRDRSIGCEGAILSNVVLSQLEAHRAFGGVVPEIAARAHISALDRVIETALDQAGLSLTDMDAIAATSGPGLIGGLLVGTVTAKALAMAAHKRFLAINHLEAHALTAMLTDQISPPYLLLLVSGGHSEVVRVDGVGRYRRLGGTIDDAVGEAFDKTAKLLGLAYPGGPEVEHHASQGDETRIVLPRPLLGRPGCDFSFAGLKTALRIEATKHAPLADQDVADLCAGFQAAVCDCIADRVQHAIDLARADVPDLATLVAAGGVAANSAIRGRLSEVGKAHGMAFAAPPLNLCGDNAAMVAWAGALRAELGQADSLDAPSRPRWPLKDLTAPGPNA